MKFQQVMILLLVAALAMIAVGVEAQCRHADDAAECTECCNQNNYLYGDFDRYGCNCDMYGMREAGYLFDGKDYD